eukprot:gnl/MRDRNA2_/MRDRNA2_86305_c0_seq4.p1 gnl/MRDRNA2_/MRDRNA2_86305_c0~~gnl/MRDRNA2_/MRDRNA2_86305_c0_seq4.p1  ORF type:complete len:120 (-),score=15.88 gnl/MRDRNA2_/MRDRNA2_86305_c0_seq4:93-452(-)
MSGNDAFTMATLGGSITAGMGCTSHWASRLKSQLPPFLSNTSFVNLAIRGSTPATVVDRWSTMKEQLNQADLIIVEYHVNEWYYVGRHLSQDAKESYSRKHNEAMMHLLLDLPKKPAVL